MSAARTSTTAYSASATHIPAYKSGPAEGPAAPLNPNTRSGPEQPAGRATGGREARPVSPAQPAARPPARRRRTAPRAPGGRGTASARLRASYWPGAPFAPPPPPVPPEFPLPVPAPGPLPPPPLLPRGVFGGFTLRRGLWRRCVEIRVVSARAAAVPPGGAPGEAARRAGARLAAARLEPVRRVLTREGGEVRRLGRLRERVAVRPVRDVHVVVPDPRGERRALDLDPVHVVHLHARVRIADPDRAWPGWACSPRTMRPRVVGGAGLAGRGAAEVGRACRCPTARSAPGSW